MKHALAVAATALALSAAPAAAQEPVVGAGSFTTAPILEPGGYRDTVLPEEYLYYGVRVGSGQRLRVKLEAGLDTREMADPGLVFVEVNMHGPDRGMLFGLSGRESTAGKGADPVDVATNPAETVEQTRDSIASGWEGPGVYFFAVYAVYAGSKELPKAEVPIEFSVAVEGQARSEPTPTPSPTPSPTRPRPPPLRRPASPKTARRSPLPAPASAGCWPASSAGSRFAVSGGAERRRAARGRERRSPRRRPRLRPRATDPRVRERSW